MVIKELTDIEVYRDALVLAREVYELNKQNSLKNEYSFIDQMKRASLSVALNIAEGYGRKTKKDFTQFLSISLGSLNEVIACLDFAALTFGIDVMDLRNKYQILAKRIYTFRSYLLNDN